jgi:hypothetical protein
VLEIRMNELSDCNRVRIETAIDCEGTIGMYNKTPSWSKRKNYGYNTQLNVTNTDTRFLELLKDITGIGIISAAGESDGISKKRWKWVLRVDEQRELLPKIKLMIKEEQRVLVLVALNLLSEHHNNYTPNMVRLEQIYADLRRLNRKGFRSEYDKILDFANTEIEKDKSLSNEIKRLEKFYTRIRGERF